MNKNIPFSFKTISISLNCMMFYLQKIIEFAGNLV